MVWFTSWACPSGMLSLNERDVFLFLILFYVKVFFLFFRRKCSSRWFFWLHVTPQIYKLLLDTITLFFTLIFTYLVLSQLLPKTQLDKDISKRCGAVLLELEGVQLVVCLEADLGQRLPYVPHVKCSMPHREFAVPPVGHSGSQLGWCYFSGGTTLEKSTSKTFNVFFS